MTQEERLYERGLKAETLMRSDEFNELFQIVVEEIGREILETPLDDPQKYREQLFLTVHGMRAFGARLTSYAVIKKNIEDDRNAQNNTQDIDN